MFGTLAGALGARHVDFDRGRYAASVEGTIEGEARVIRITKIHVHYKLEVVKGQRAEAERALQVHPLGCPAHESVKDAIAITWDCDLTEA